MEIIHVVSTQMEKAKLMLCKSKWIGCIGIVTIPVKRAVILVLSQVSIITFVKNGYKHQGNYRNNYESIYNQCHAKICANIALTSNRQHSWNFNTLQHKYTPTKHSPLIYYLCTAAAPISSNWHQLQCTCILFLTESLARAFGADSEKSPQTTLTSNPISVHALHAGYKAAREQRLVVFMCLACLSVNWWSLWSLSVNAAAVAKGQAAR